MNGTRQPPAATTTSTPKHSFARRAAAATAAALVLAASPVPPPPALAAFASASSASPEKVADFAASGILFRDAVEITALEDPDVIGATVFVADFKRSLTAKLAKDFFSEPSQASITCAADPNLPLRVVNAARVRAAGGAELFSERKGLSLVANKTLRVRRVFDAKRSALLYVSYSTRLSDDADTASTRYRTSVCALPLPAEAFGGGGGGGGGGSAEGLSGGS
jgi:CreA protein